MVIKNSDPADVESAREFLKNSCRVLKVGGKTLIVPRGADPKKIESLVKRICA